MKDMARRARRRRAGQPIDAFRASRRDDRLVRSVSGISAEFLDQVERFGGTPELMARLRLYAQAAESSVETPVAAADSTGAVGGQAARRTVQRALSSEDDSVRGRGRSAQTVGDRDVDRVGGRPSMPGTVGLTPPGGSGSRRHRLGWERHFRFAVVASDLLANAFGLSIAAALVGTQANVRGSWTLSIWAAVTVAAVCGALLVGHAWQDSVLGQGAEEFRRFGRALLVAGLALAVVALAANESIGRVWVFLVVPTIAVLATVQRYMLRRYLHRQRRVGKCLLSVLAAGSTENVYNLIERTRKFPHLGWRVEAVCTVDGRAGSGNRIAGVPVVGQLADVGEHVRRGGYRIVGITADGYWTPRRLQQLAWDLESSNAEMIVVPVLMDVTGARASLSRLLGTPVLRVSAPVFTGARRAVKEVFDRVGAVVLLLTLAPLLLAIGVAVKLSGQGPVLYRQERVGKNGKPFVMFKFRTMVVSAEAARIMTRLVTEGAGPLFKMREDPRVTKVGIWLRHYSADELPQLWNVVTGAMSLVGPRPPLPEEARTYGPELKRRLLIKPGMTGLWQVSGRSDLSWEESVQLDLRYVEDWSLVLDVLILWKTIYAVLSGEGAY